MPAIKRANTTEVIRLYHFDNTIEGQDEIRKIFSIPKGDKCADIVGHRPECVSVVIEIESSNLLYAIEQLEVTTEFVTQNRPVGECAIVLKRWKKFYSKIFKKDDDDYLCDKNRQNRLLVNNRYPILIINIVG